MIDMPPLKTKVEVSWVDIVTSGGWVDVDKMEAEVKSPEPCTTLGFLSYVDPDGAYICVSHTLGINAPDQYNGHISIPIGCIRNIEVLKD